MPSTASNKEYFKISPRAGYKKLQNTLLDTAIVPRNLLEPK